MQGVLRFLRRSLQSVSISRLLSNVRAKLQPSSQLASATCGCRQRTIAASRFPSNGRKSFLWLYSALFDILSLSLSLRLFAGGTSVLPWVQGCWMTWQALGLHLHTLRRVHKQKAVFRTRKGSYLGQVLSIALHRIYLRALAILLCVLCNRCPHLRTGICHSKAT